MHNPSQLSKQPRSSRNGMLSLLLLIAMIAGGTGYAVINLERELIDMYKPFAREADANLVGDPVHGKQVFNTTCIVCHGPTGSGVPTLGANLNQSKFVRSRTDTQLVNFIKGGRLPTDPNSVMKGTMPPRGANPSLDDAGLRDAVAYVRTLQAAALANPAAFAMPAPVATIMGLADAGNNPALAGEIHYAARDGDLSKAQSLLKNNPDLVASKDHDGHTALHWAAERGHKDVAELLLDNKADINAKDNKGLTPLYLSAYGGYKNVAKFLIASNADVNAKDNDGITPLQTAAGHGHNDVVKLLLTKNADINAKNNMGETALHSVALKDEKEIAETLLANNADVNAKDNKGQTPLHDALITNHKELAEMLRQHGGNE